jgi:hypothetical protein
VGALGHYLEAAGIPTTQISLIREHTEKIRPPRALWVPFELGRPLGVPNDADFQRNVLLAALRLLERSEGPVLVDYPEDAPVMAGSTEILSCPYVPPQDGAVSEREIASELKQEIAAYQPWYQQVRGEGYQAERSLSKLTLETIADLLGDLQAHADLQTDRLATGQDHVLRYAIEDLKAFYFTALSAQPGLRQRSGDEVERWFWQETAAGRFLRLLQKTCRESQHPTLENLSRQIIPNRYRKELEV